MPAFHGGPCRQAASAPNFRFQLSAFSARPNPANPVNPVPNSPFPCRSSFLLGKIKSPFDCLPFQLSGFNFPPLSFPLSRGSHISRFHSHISNPVNPVSLRVKSTPLPFSRIASDTVGPLKYFHRCPPSFGPLDFGLSPSWLLAIGDAPTPVVCPPDGAPFLSHARTIPANNPLRPVRVNRKSKIVNGMRPPTPIPKLQPTPLLTV